jgi:diguanylate cyclase (GGDEF)-like protein/PAS domain S-box-containing protein
MPAAALPKDESRRLAALRDLDILDTAPSEALDSIARAASLVCGTPIGLVSLVDEHRQWFKANIGLEGVTETPREMAFCAHAILGDDILEVEDARLDARFADNPLVTGQPAIRSYAGAPLILGDGSKVGTLCMIDQRPRRLNPHQLDVLRELARAASQALEQWRTVRRQAEAEARLRESEDLLARTGELAGVGGWALDLGTRKLTWTEETYRIYGVDRSYEPRVETAIAFYPPAERPAVAAAIDHATRTGESWDLELPFVRADGKRIWVRTIGRATFEDGRPMRVAGAFQDITERMERTRALRDAQERVTLATESGRIGIWDLNLVTGVETWSPLLYRLYGLAPQKGPAPPHLWRQCIHPDDLERAERESNEAIAGLRPYATEFRVVWPDGSVHDIRASATVTFDKDKRAVRMVGANWDVTESRQMAARLANQHELLRVTLQSIGDGVITTDAQGRTVWMNPVAERLTGWTAAEATGRPMPEVFRIVNETTREALPNPLDKCLAPATGEMRRAIEHGAPALLLSRHGGEFGIEESAAPIRSDTGEILGMVLVFHDVTAQRALSGEMTYRATHDALTGLLNRAEFEVRLRALLHKTQVNQHQSVLLFIDLDEFKLVNDTAGHEAGDMLLKDVARLLNEMVRSGDSVARLGGDEFAVLLERCTLQQAVPVAQKICARMEDFRFIHHGQRFRVAASIGLVPVDDRWPEISGVMQAADAACYAAKEAGRNRVHVWYDTDQALLARHGEMQWAGRLAQALDEDRFVLFAQRIAALQPAATQGSQGIHAEVLLRLVGQDGSISPPGAFLPAAERFHMISRIDRWVLNRAIGWMKTVPSLAAIDMLSINLSGQSVADAAFCAWAAGRLAEAGPKICRRLCLEITETTVVTSLTDAARFIEQVREFGVRVALDDFGAGASSFGYLKRLPVDFLKIDGQFVRNLLSDPLDEAAVRSFTDVAGVAGLLTIAEFVESEAVLEKLRSMGVDYAQGYLIHKPAPIDELMAVGVRDLRDRKQALLF